MASAQKGCLTRLQKEYKSLLREPVPHVEAHPLPNNLLEWHFVLEGAKGTDFEGGLYHGKLVFPPTYPFKPPSISFFTPNGRFAVNTKLCTSFSDFHPESWNPMWSVGTILTGLLSFMYDKAPTTGSVSTSKAEKQRLAADSLSCNVKNATFRKLFPQWVEEHSKRAAAAAQQQQQQQQAPGQAGEQQQQQVPGQGGAQQQQGPAGPAAAVAGAGAAQNNNPQHSNGGGWAMVALVVVVLAVAVVPLFSTQGAASMGLEVLSRLRS